MRNKPLSRPIRPRSTRNSPPWPKLFGSREFIPVAEADDAKSANIHNRRGNTYRCCHRSRPNFRTAHRPRCRQQPPALVPDAKQQAEMAENIKELQELKAQNDEILKQQQAALDALDDLQKEADQMRIYSKRG